MMKSFSDIADSEYRHSSWSLCIARSWRSFSWACIIDAVMPRGEAYSIKIVRFSYKKIQLLMLDFFRRVYHSANKKI